MNILGLLNGITNRLNGDSNNMEVRKIVLLGNMIEIEGVITIIDLSKDDRYDYDYRVATRDSVETFVNSRLAIDVIIKEVKNIRDFKAGATVEKDGNKFMLVPTEGVNGLFRLLDLGTLEVGFRRVTKVELYKEEYYLEGGK